MTINLFYSNSIDKLAESLAEKISSHNDIFSPVTIIIPNPYLKKWLQLKIADKNRIAVNIDFQIIDNGLFNAFVDSNKKNSIKIIKEDELQLIIYHILINNIDKEELKPLEQYINKNSTSEYYSIKKTWQLSSMLSKYFLEYENYRQEMISSWKNNRTVFNSDLEKAQSFIYKEVFVNKSLSNTSNKQFLTLNELFQISKKNININKKLYLFGVSQLSPLYTELIYHLGIYSDISIYQLNPCKEYWEDVITTEEKRWEIIKAQKVIEKEGGEELEMLEDDNELLQLWGKPGREAIKLLSSLEDASAGKANFISQWIDDDISQKNLTLLQIIKNDVLNRIDKREDHEKVQRDNSVQIFSAPDIFIEVQTIYNSILLNLENDSFLKQDDIAIMVPDMELYGSVVKTIFSQQPKRISYNLIDSNAAVESNFSRAILSLFQVLSGDISREDLNLFITNPFFLSKFNIEKIDVEEWLSTIDKLNIFYSKSSEESANSWERGLRRLRLGRIMEIPDENLENDFLSYNEIVPYTSAIDSESNTIFTSIVENLLLRSKELKKKKYTITEWNFIINELISEFFRIDYNLHEEIAVRDELLFSLERLLFLNSLESENSKKHRFSLDFMVDYIKENLKSLSSSRGDYPLGGVNISGLIPKRQIPFKIVYIAGMSGNRFPGIIDKSSLDLKSHKRKIGDINRSELNKYLFLETIISAKEKIYLSYVSRDLQSDKDFNPNSILNQLIHYIETNIIKEKYSIINIPISISREKYLIYNAEELKWNDVFGMMINEQWHPALSTNLELLELFPDVVVDKIKADKFRKNDKSKEEIHLLKNITFSGYNIKQFFKNPIEFILKYHYSINDISDETELLREEFPISTGYPENFLIKNRIVNSVLSCKSDTSYINSYYEHLQLTGNSPSEVFGKIDLDNNIQNIDYFLKDADELKKRLDEEYSFYEKLTIGDVLTKEDVDNNFKCQLTLTIDEKEIQINLNHSIEYIWKGKSNCETILVAKNFSPFIVLDVFIFYLISMSGINKELNEFIGDEPLIINIFTDKGLKRYRCIMDPKNAESLLKTIISDMLNPDFIYLIPFKFLTGKSFKFILNKYFFSEEELLSESEINEFREIYLNAINEELEQGNPSFELQDVMNLFENDTPHNIHEIIKSRFIPVINALEEVK